MRKVRFMTILHLSKEDQKHETEAIYGGADCLCPAAGGIGHAVRLDVIRADKKQKESVR